MQTDDATQTYLGLCGVFYFDSHLRDFQSLQSAAKPNEYGNDVPTSVDADKMEN